MMKGFLALLLSLLLCSLARSEDPKPPPPPAVSLKKQLAATPLTGVIIPTITLDQASLSEAIAIFTKLVQAQTKDAVQLQWVFKDIDISTWKPTFTFNAKNISASKLLAEILSQTKVEAKLDEHAILLRPLGSASKEPAPATPPPAAPKAPDNFGKNSRLDLNPSLDRSRIEAAVIDGKYDKEPIKGRNPIK